MQPYSNLLGMKLSHAITTTCRAFGHTIWVVSMHPVAGFVQGMHSMSMAADDSLLWAGPSESAVLCFHKAHPQPLRRVGDETPQVGLLIGLIHVGDACQV